MNIKRNNSKTPFPLFFLCLIALILFLSSTPALAKPKTKVHFGYSPEGFARVQIQNETTKELACWVAIDGFKKKFFLPARATSRWFTANDKRYNYQSFSTWCDYIDLHPEYKNYRSGGKAFN